MLQGRTTGELILVGLFFLEW